MIHPIIIFIAVAGILALEVSVSGDARWANGLLRAFCAIGGFALCCLLIATI